MATAPTTRRQRLLATRHVGQLARFSGASLVAVAVSQVTFLVVYALGVAAGPASAIGFVAGVAPNYVLSRRWAFGRRGRSDATREVLPYAAMVAASLVATVVGTDLAEGWVVTWGLARTWEVLAVTAAFAVVNGVLFLGKYVVMDRWLFGPGVPQRPDADPADGGDDRSRHQVPSSTRP